MVLSFLPPDCVQSQWSGWGVASNVLPFWGPCAPPVGPDCWLGGRCTDPTGVPPNHNIFVDTGQHLKKLLGCVVCVCAGISVLPRLISFFLGGEEAHDTLQHDNSYCIACVYVCV